MVLTSPDHISSSNSPKRVTLGLLMSISALMALCAKHASRVSTKLKTTAKPGRRRSSRSIHLGYDRRDDRSPKLPPKSPLTGPRQLLTQISNKAITLVHSHKKRVAEENDVVAPDDFGDGGVWQKAILMGDKCQPLDFSGVIYYDCCGNQLNELPFRSPRASPLPAYLTHRK